MQKWEKLLLITLFILAILGYLLGVLFIKCGVLEIKILAGMDAFSFTELILLIIVVICAALDIYGTYESKNEFGAAKFKLIFNTKNRLRNILIFLILITICEFISFFMSFYMSMLPLCFITLILTLICLFHNRIDNGISENGILYWGIYHSFNDVKSYKFESETLIGINIPLKFCKSEYNNVIKFNIDKNDKEYIEKFLEERL